MEQESVMTVDPHELSSASSIGELDRNVRPGTDALSYDGAYDEMDFTSRLSPAAALQEQIRDVNDHQTGRIVDNSREIAPLVESEFLAQTRHRNRSLLATQITSRALSSYGVFAPMLNASISSVSMHNSSLSRLPSTSSTSTTTTPIVAPQNSNDVEAMGGTAHWRTHDSFDAAILAMANPQGAASLIKIMAVCNLGSFVFLVQTAASWWMTSIHAKFVVETAGFWGDLETTLGVQEYCRKMLKVGIVLVKSIAYGPAYSPTSVLPDFFGTFSSESNRGLRRGGYNDIFEKLDSCIIWTWLLLQIFIGSIKLALRLYTLYQCRQLRTSYALSDHSDPEGRLEDNDLDATVVDGEGTSSALSANFTMQSGRLSMNDDFQRRERIDDIIQSSCFRWHVVTGRIAQLLMMYGFVLYFGRVSIWSLSPVQKWVNGQRLEYRAIVSHHGFAMRPKHFFSLENSEIHAMAECSTRLSSPSSEKNDPSYCSDNEASILLGSPLTSEDSESLNIRIEKYPGTPGTGIASTVLLETCCTNLIVCLFRALLALGVVHFHVAQERREALRRRSALRKEKQGLVYREIEDLLDTEKYNHCRLASNCEHNHMADSNTMTAKNFDTSSDMCSICLEYFEHGEMLRVLPCDARHRFHGNCIKKWLVKCCTCPLCQGNLRSLMIAKRARLLEAATKAE